MRRTQPRLLEVEGLYEAVYEALESATLEEVNQYTSSPQARNLMLQAIPLARHHFRTQLQLMGRTRIVFHFRPSGASKCRRKLPPPQQSRSGLVRRL